MATIYYPSGTAPYNDYYYIGHSNTDKYGGPARSKQYGAIVTSANLWKNGSTGNSTYARSRLKVDYTIKGMSASVTITLQMGRTNGDYGGGATVTAYIDDVSIGSKSNYVISSGCTQRDGSNNSGDCAVMPNSYFDNIGSTSFTLTANSSGNFSKKIKVRCNSGTNNYKLAEKSVTISFGGGQAANTAGDAPTISNPGNNSFSITGDSGDAGVNNSITETTLLWKITGDADWRPRPKNTNTLDSTTLSSLGIGSSTASIKVWAKTRYKCTYPANTYIYSSESNAVINNYQPPALPDTPSITSAKNVGKAKPRFTIKEDWTASWPESSPANTSSNVTGYKVALRKNGEDIYLGDTTSSERTWTIDPIELTLAPKDTVQIGVKPYTTNGAGTKIYNANYKYGPDPAITVQNAAVVRVKVGTGKNTWVEGQVWIKGSDKKWHEADVVKIKTDDGWKESE